MNPILVIATITVASVIAIYLGIKHDKLKEEI